MLQKKRHDQILRHNDKIVTHAKEKTVLTKRHIGELDLLIFK